MYDQHNIVRIFNNKTFDYFDLLFIYRNRKYVYNMRKVLKLEFVVVQIQSGYNEHTVRDMYAYLFIFDSVLLNIFRLSAL